MPRGVDGGLSGRSGLLCAHNFDAVLFNPVGDGATIDAADLCDFAEAFENAINAHHLLAFIYIMGVGLPVFTAGAFAFAATIALLAVSGQSGFHHSSFIAVMTFIFQRAIPLYHTPCTTRFKESGIALEIVGDFAFEFIPQSGDKEAEIAFELSAIDRQFVCGAFDGIDKALGGFLNV